MPGLLFTIEHILLLVRMELSRAATLRVQTAISVFNNTALRPADSYSFTDADTAPSVVTDLSEGTQKYNHSSKCVCLSAVWQTKQEDKND
jgi:hypothetical protein